MHPRSPHRVHLVPWLALAALLAGCGHRQAPEVQARPAVDGAPAPAELAFRGEMRLAPGEPAHVVAQATATNTGGVPARVEYGACALRLRAYPASGGGGEPAWRSERRQPWESTALYACDLSLFVGELGPGSPRRRGRSGAPDWTSAPLCDPEPTRTVLRGGQTMDFDLRVPTRRVLGAGRPPGRYHFVAVVQTATQRVFLSAGEATLGR